MCSFAIIELGHIEPEKNVSDFRNTIDISIFLFVWWSLEQHPALGELIPHASSKKRTGRNKYEILGRKFFKKSRNFRFFMIIEIEEFLNVLKNTKGMVRPGL